MRKFSLLVASMGVAILGLAAYAHAFGGHHGHHHGSPALAACLATAPKSVKANLWSTFKNSPLRGDEQTVRADKQAIAQFILGINTSTPLSTLESNLSTAQLKVIQDEDTIAQTVCTTQGVNLSAAATLYTNLQNNRATVRGYFAAAHSAAGQ